MEEEYELDLTYITERVIAMSFPRGCSEEIYSHNLKDVTRMLKSKHADNYLIINLSERRQELSKMNPKTLDTGWPDLHAPPLDKICTICKAMENWLNADPLHVVVIHCRGGKGRIGVVISSFVHFTDVSASADQALDRFAMRKYYDDKVSALMTPSQKRYVWILNSLLSGSMKINASPLFLHCVIIHGIPNFDANGVCHPYIKVYQGMQAVYSSGIYHIGPGHREHVCITLEPAQLLKGDIMIKCYHKNDLTSEREVIFRLQFHTGAVQGYNLMYEKEDMENANKDPRFPDYGKVELVFSEGPEKIPGANRWQNGADVTVDYNTADPLTRWDSYQNICDGEGTVSPLLPFSCYYFSGIQCFLFLTYINTQTQTLFFSQGSNTALTGPVLHVTVGVQCDCINMHTQSPLAWFMLQWSVAGIITQEWDLKGRQTSPVETAFVMVTKGDGSYSLPWCKKS
uniref:Tensin 3 n=1 Tax=Mastacembelus armatus TaxID=205130 RepID=A0A7N8XP68_9TELE